MDTAGIIPEEDMQQDREESTTEEAEGETTERLSVFEDFLEKLDKTEPEDDDEEENKN
jgi:hypothetical protein